jgi:hypothetical protein
MTLLIVIPAIFAWLTVQAGVAAAATYTAPSASDPFSGATQPNLDFGRLTNEPFFQALATNVKNVFLGFVSDNFAWVILGITLVILMAFGPALMSRFRWGPGAREGSHGQGQMKL